MVKPQQSTSQHQAVVDALQRDKLAAETASRSKSEFVSWVSHELRTPLNGILGFAQLMMLDREHPLPPVQLRRLEVLQQSGTRLQALVDQLLVLSRVEHGDLKLRLKVIDVEPSIERCMDIVMPLANAHGIEVSIEAARGFVPVRADADALEQVVLNLLSNAVKYNRTNGRVAVRFETAERGVLTVEDTGVGMTDCQLGRLFEPFNRLGAERTTTQGSGLGLVISRKLVQAMGGTLEVWSEAGSGSRFAVSLPLGVGSRSEDRLSIRTSG